jgi:hypothetical protein
MHLCWILLSFLFLNRPPKPVVPETRTAARLLPFVEALSGRWHWLPDCNGPDLSFGHLGAYLACG